MKKNLGVYMLSFIVLISLISLANAEIIISQPKTLYSLGDNLELQIKIDSIKVGYMDVNLNCLEQDSWSLYHNTPDSKSIVISRKLIPAYIGSSSGSCHISASYEEDSANSANFEISDEIILSFESQEISIDAGKTAVIKGTATKKNGQLAGQIQSASITATLNENIFSSEIIKDGQFTLKLTIPENAHAGTYRTQIKTSDKDEQGNILNSGETNVDILVVQKPAKIEFAADKSSINPGESLTIIPFLYDVAGDLINGKILLKFQDSQGKRLVEQTIDANQNVTIKTSYYQVPGQTILSAENGNITAQRIIQTNELKKIGTEIKNNTITVTNLGNVLYQDIVKFQIGDKEISKEVSIGVMESKSYSVSAPSGNYDLSILENNGESVSLGSVALTGKSIQISEIKEGLSSFYYRYPIMWGFLCVIFLSFLVAVYKRYDLNKTLGIGFTGEANVGAIGARNNKISGELRKKGGVEVVNPKQVLSNLVTANQDIRKAEQVLVMNGRQQPVSVVALKIKNGTDGIKGANIKNAFEIAYNLKGVSYTSGACELFIFSPMVTRNMKNEETAIKAAMKIDNFLKEHNRKFRNDAIEYGIGVNSGDLINLIDKRVLQFTNTGKTIGTAKRVAESANNEVLLSKEIHEKTPSVKTERIASGSLDLFSVKRVVNHEESKQFINEFLRRNDMSKPAKSI